jgi:hypothetical protein
VFGQQPVESQYRPQQFLPPNQQQQQAHSPHQQHQPNQNFQNNGFSYPNNGNLNIGNPNNGYQQAGGISEMGNTPLNFSYSQNPHASSMNMNNNYNSNIYDMNTINMNTNNLSFKSMSIPPHITKSKEKEDPFDFLN